MLLRLTRIKRGPKRLASISPRVIMRRMVSLESLKCADASSIVPQ